MSRLSPPDSSVINREVLFQSAFFGGHLLVNGPRSCSALLRLIGPSHPLTKLKEVSQRCVAGSVRSPVQPLLLVRSCSRQAVVADHASSINRAGRTSSKTRQKGSRKQQRHINPISPLNQYGQPGRSSRYISHLLFSSIVMSKIYFLTSRQKLIANQQPILQPLPIPPSILLSSLTFQPVSTDTIISIAFGLSSITLSFSSLLVAYLTLRAMRVENCTHYLIYSHQVYRTDARDTDHDDDRTLGLGPVLRHEHTYVSIPHNDTSNILDQERVKRES